MHPLSSTCLHSLDHIKPLIGKSCSSKIHLSKNVEWGKNILVKMLAGKSQEVRLNTCLIKDIPIGHAQHQKHLLNVGDDHPEMQL